MYLGVESLFRTFLWCFANARSFGKEISGMNTYKPQESFSGDRHGVICVCRCWDIVRAQKKIRRHRDSRPGYRGNLKLKIVFTFSLG